MAILIAYDGSDDAKAAVAAAAELFGGRQALVASVWSSVKSAAPAGLVAVPPGVAAEAFAKLDEEALRETQALADEGARLAREAGLEASGRAVRSHGSTWAALVHLADEESVDAIVVGSRGRSDFKSALLGSVSSGIAHHSSRPVLVAPHERPA